MRRPLADRAVARLREVLAEPPAPPPPDLEGTRYTLVDFLDRGGMGTVHRVVDRVLEREVALKVLALGDPDGAIAERMVREAKVLAQLEHPGIVPVHDVGRLADGRVFTAMKLVRGDRLDVWLERARAASGAQPLDERMRADRLRLFLRICEAVAFAHAKGVLHRDLKPANVMLGPFGEVLVMDWGLAKWLAPAAAEAAAEAAAGSRVPPAHADRATSGGLEPSAAAPGSAVHTASGSVLGTPGYMAPEQARGASDELDVRTDVYALGAILADLLAEPAASGARRVVRPRPLASIVARAMQQAPADRYPSVGELAADVERWLAREPVRAHREGPLEWTRRFVARYDAAILLVVTYLLLRVLFVVFSRR
jgi:serine/threonine protein kinase